MIPYIIESSLENRDLCFKAFDSLSSYSMIDNELFIGDCGITNLQGINKPSYYAYYFLSKLGEEIIEKGEGYIVTRNGEDIQILLYNSCENIKEFIFSQDFSKVKGIKNIYERKFSLNIVNLLYDYNVIKYCINSNMGSSYNYWLNLGKPKRVPNEHSELLRKASYPKISFGYAKKSAVFNIVSKIPSYGAELIILKKVQKHLY
jgi:beta-xylosidase